MTVIKKKHVLNIQTEGKSSRFLVDLARNLKEKEEQKIRAIEASFGCRFKKFFYSISGVAKAKWGNVKSAVCDFFGGFKNIFSRSFFTSNKYKKLSFYFLFNLFFKINYFTGWLVIFGIRLIVLTPVLIVKKIGSLLAEARAERRRYDKRKELETVEKHMMESDIFPIERILEKTVGDSKPHFALSFAKKEKKSDFSFESFKTFASRLVPRFSFSLVKQVAVFSVLLLVIIIPLKVFFHYKDFAVFRGKVLGASTSAVDDMKNSSGNISDLNFDKAVKNFADAANNFKIARNQISELNVVLGALAAVVPSKDVKLAAQADLYLRAGELTASVANRIGSSLELFDAKNLKIKDVLNILYENLNSSNKEIVELGEILKKIDLENLPDEYREKVGLFQEGSADISRLFNELTRLVDGSRKILGFDHDRRYLVIFQNNTEMRGSGGFVGSYALADFRNGEMVNLEVPTGGSYDTEAGYLARVAAPEPLQLVNPLWHFWDANWWPDWALSAKKLMWFYEKSNGPTVDGVIAITPNVMADLLKIIGPLNLQDKYGVTITSDNFWNVVQDIVEKKPEKIQDQATTTLLKIVEQKHEPKKIIGDMMNLIMDKVSKELSRKDFLDILKIAYENLNEKHILAYFVDEDLEKLTDDFDWAGLMDDIDGDYLMVANANIAGAKSDKKIKENISLLREVAADGSIVNTLKIQRRHTAIRGEEFTGVRNVNWMRIYVPAGSELIEATGFSQPDGKFFEKPVESWKKDEDVLRGEGTFSVDGESDTRIYQELGKTVFANWTMVDPGEQILITIKYRLPFVIKKNEPVEPKGLIGKIMNDKEADSYAPLKLLVQKQPGSQGSNFISNLLLPGNMQVAWQNSDSLNYENRLNVDRSWVLLLKVD